MKTKKVENKLPANTYTERADHTWSQDSIRLFNTPALSIRNSFLYVQETGYFETAPPYFTERSGLKSYLIIYTLSGRGLLKYRDESYTLAKGTTAYINCMDPHYYEAMSGEPWIFLWLHFDGIQAMGYYQEFLRSGFHLLTHQDPFFMESTMRRIIAHTKKKAANSEIIISGLINQIITQLLSENIDTSLLLGIMPGYIKSSLDFIAKNYMNDLTLEFIADHANISKFYLDREFKRYIGTPIGEYVIQTRINNSKEFLKYSDDSVEMISEKCGFHYTSHFIRQFKKSENMTPLQYRKLWN